MNSKITDIDLLVSKFLDKTLPAAEWTHAAHLTVGLYFVAEYGAARAMDMMRSCIFTYNESVGTVNNDTSGYHETITRFWIWLLNAYWEQVADKSKLTVACEILLQSEFSKKDIFFRFYSRELLFSKEARKSYLAPDLAPLDLKIVELS